MKLFECCCKWRYIIGSRQVYGPIYEIGLPGHYTGPNGCMHVGRMMTHAEFTDWYGDCAACAFGEHHHAVRA